MNYSARGPRELMLFLLLGLLIGGYQTDGFPYYVILSILILLLAFIRYTLTINDDQIVYKIFCFSIPVHYKIVIPNEIERMIFKRYGWATKGVSIKLHKGLSIRVAKFTPKGIFDQLEKFSREKGVAIEKTKDYLILEKMERK
ncbi:hypothetical protein GMD78_06190 [Ornithinibacillus sp. L9]|uniref:PH domain-containing protein n=1 Tax=Ornithinibacillus caprae TaxID=2678566 RepID=A0A6N8FJ38_9BACI|nr:hypothetical protein [Ornithinibacillus caprae]MUK87987.1 hypothetical protein [Ornithinibacillus caprae]